MMSHLKRCFSVLVLLTISSSAYATGKLAPAVRTVKPEQAANLKLGTRVRVFSSSWGGKPTHFTGTIVTTGKNGNEGDYIRVKGRQRMPKSLGGKVIPSTKLFYVKGSEERIVGDVSVLKEAGPRAAKQAR
jgi:hypothetical protein